MSQQDTPHQSQRKTSYIKKSLQNQLGPIHFCCESMICLIQSQNEHISYVLFFKQEKRNHELQQNKFPGTKDTMKCSAKINQKTRNKHNISDDTKFKTINPVLIKKNKK